ncbi:hypothetical protein ACFL35_13830 [Candidatus Riflebacteria bacterium]
MSLIQEKIEKKITEIKALAVNGELDLDQLFELLGEFTFVSLAEVFFCLHTAGILLKLESQDALIKSFHCFFIQEKRTEKFITMKEIGTLLSERELTPQIDLVYRVIEILGIEIVPFLPSSTGKKDETPEVLEKRDSFENELDDINTELDLLVKDFEEESIVEAPAGIIEVAKQIDEPGQIGSVAEELIEAEKQDLVVEDPAFPSSETIDLTGSAIDDSIKESNLIQEPVEPSIQSTNLYANEVSNYGNAGAPPESTVDSERMQDAINQAVLKQKELQKEKEQISDDSTTTSKPAELFEIVKGAKIEHVLDNLIHLNARQGYITMNDVKESRIQLNARYVPISDVLIRIKLKKLNLINPGERAFEEDEEKLKEQEEFVPEPITSREEQSNSSEIAPGVHLNFNAYEPGSENLQIFSEMEKSDDEKLQLPSGESKYDIEKLKAPPDFWDHAKKVKREQRKKKARLQQTVPAPTKTVNSSRYLWLIVSVPIVIVLIFSFSWLHNKLKPEKNYYQLKNPIIENVQLKSEVEIFLKNPEKFTESPLKIQPLFENAQMLINSFKKLLKNSVKPFLDKKQIVYFDELDNLLLEIESNHLLAKKSPGKMEEAYRFFQKVAYKSLHGENKHKLSYYLENYSNIVKEYYSLGKKAHSSFIRSGKFELSGTAEENGLQKGGFVEVFLVGRTITAKIGKIEESVTVEQKKIVTGYLDFDPLDYPYLNPKQYLKIRVESIKKKTLYMVPRRTIQYDDNGIPFLVAKDKGVIVIKVDREEKKLAYVLSEELAILMSIELPAEH